MPTEHEHLAGECSVGVVAGRWHWHHAYVVHVLPGGTSKNGGSCQALGYNAGGYTGVHGTVHEGTVG
jgi:hypothetical protein